MEPDLKYEEPKHLDAAAIVICCLFIGILLLAGWVLLSGC